MKNAQAVNPNLVPGAAVSIEPFYRRVLLPAAMALLIGIGLYILNMIDLPVENRSLYRFLKNSFLILLYAHIWLSGALFVYPFSYNHGASLRERLLASLVVPLAYIFSEIVRVTEYFSLGEALYYGLSTMGLLTLSLQVGLLGAAEMVCRGRQRARTGLPRRVISVGPVAAVIFMLVCVYLLVLWGMGVHWFYIYQEGYKLLFSR